MTTNELQELSALLGIIATLLPLDNAARQRVLRRAYARTTRRQPGMVRPLISTGCLQRSIGVAE